MAGSAQARYELGEAQEVLVEMVEIGYWGGGGVAACRRDLLELLAIFYDIDCACGKLTGKIANGDHIIAAPHNAEIMSWASDPRSESHGCRAAAMI